MSEQIIQLEETEELGILYNVFNNENQIFQIELRNYEEIIKVLKFKREELDLSGFQYEIAFDQKYLIDNKTKDLGFLVLFFDKSTHDKPYIYYFKENKLTNELGSKFSIDDNGIVYVLDTFDILMSYRNDTNSKTMNCWSCSETSRKDNPNRVINSPIIDDNQYCDQCKQELQDFELWEKESKEPTLYESWKKIYKGKSMREILEDYSDRKGKYHYWEQTVIHIRCVNDLSCQDVMQTIMFEDHLGENFPMFCSLCGHSITPENVYNVTYEKLTEEKE